MVLKVLLSVGAIFALSCLMELTDSESVPDSGQVKTNLAVVPYDEASIPIFHRGGRDFTFGSIKIQIKQDWRNMGVAAVVWDAAVVLGEYLYGKRGLLQGQRVIELGAGTGLAGIVAALLGAKVTLTDRKSALGSLRENVQFNMASQTADLPCAVEICELDWGVNLEKFPQTYDMVLGADIIYIEDTFPQLLRTLTHLSDCNTLVFISCKIRYERDSRFLNEMMKDSFVVEEVVYDKERDIHVYACRKKC